MTVGTVISVHLPYFLISYEELKTFLLLESEVVLWLKISIQCYVSESLRYDKFGDALDNVLPDYHRLCKLLVRSAKSVQYC